MSEMIKDCEFPVLKMGEDLAKTDEEKAIMLWEEFIKVHSSGNLWREWEKRFEN